MLFDHGPAKPRLIKRRSFKINTDGEYFSRAAIPLVYSWAMTIHKSQGKTVTRAEMDLSKCFEDGMVYVGASRLTDLKGLRLLGFDRTKVRANPKAKRFWESLSKLQT